VEVVQDLVPLLKEKNVVWCHARCTVIKVIWWTASVNISNRRKTTKSVHNPTRKREISYKFLIRITHCSITKELCFRTQNFYSTFMDFICCFYLQVLHNWASKWCYHWGWGNDFQSPQGAVIVCVCLTACVHTFLFMCSTYHFLFSLHL
jgi:hypothetical protein